MVAPRVESAAVEDGIAETQRVVRFSAPPDFVHLHAIDSLRLFLRVDEFGIAV
jgi:hypothetical protein